MSKKKGCFRGKHWLLSAPDDKKGAKTYNENVGLAMTAELAKYPEWKQRPIRWGTVTPLSWRAHTIHNCMAPAKQKRMRKLCKYRDRSFYGYTHCPF